MDLFVRKGNAVSDFPLEEEKGSHKTTLCKRVSILLTYTEAAFLYLRTLIIWLTSANWSNMLSCINIPYCFFLIVFPFLAFKEHPNACHHSSLWLNWKLIMKQLRRSGCIGLKCWWHRIMHANLRSGPGVQMSFLLRNKSMIQFFLQSNLAWF